MTSLRLPLMVFLLVMATFTASFGQRTPAGSATKPGVSFDDLVRSEMTQRKIPGMQVAVVQRGEIVLLKFYGVASVQDSTPVTNRTVFSINSCTKAFTGVAIMQLVEAGKLDLSAPVSRYLDDLPAAWQPITIRQLLTHLSGLPDISAVLDTAREGIGIGAQFNEAAIWAKTKALPMAFPTGQQYSYNQTNYALLGKIIDQYTPKALRSGI